LVRSPSACDLPLARSMRPQRVSISPWTPMRTLRRVIRAQTLRVRRTLLCWVRITSSGLDVGVRQSSRSPSCNSLQFPQRRR
jgi:hypothetical protein